jgi:hypothetical protein
MRKDSVTQAGIGHASQHGGLNHGDDLAGLGSDHRKAEDAVAVHRDQCFIKPRVSEIVRVRNTAGIGSFATRMGMPRRLASFRSG